MTFPNPTNLQIKIYYYTSLLKNIKYFHFQLTIKFWSFKHKEGFCCCYFDDIMKIC